MEKAKNSFAAFFTAKNLAYLAVLLALLTLFQCLAGFGLFTFGSTSLSFSLVPIVLGGILLGWGAGAFLGFAFGFIVLMFGVAGTDAFTATLLADVPFMTVLICLVKGIAAGVVPALLYRLIARKNKLAAVIVAALSAPIVNTALFILGCLCITNTIAVFQAPLQMEGMNIFVFILVGIVTYNFFIEFAINLVLAPALHRVVVVVEKQLGRKKKNKFNSEQRAVSEETEVPSEPEKNDL